jgi:hypothetical protein
VLSTPLVTAWSGIGARPAPGTHGWLLSALSGRVRGDEGDKVASQLAGLACTRAGQDAFALATEVCWVDEGTQQLTIALRASQQASARLVSARGATHGGRQAGAADGDHADLTSPGARWSQAWPLQDGSLLGLESVTVPTRGAAPRDQAWRPGEEPPPDVDEMAWAVAWTPAYAHHPVPLLVPVGAAGTDHVWHVNLAALSNLLIAAGSVGGAQGLALTLLAHIAAQAHPSQVEMMVVAAPGTALTLLEGLPHLGVPCTSTQESRRRAPLAR